MPKCPYCALVQNTQAEIDNHVDQRIDPSGVHIDGAGVLIANSVVDEVANAWTCEANVPVNLSVRTNWRGVIVDDDNLLVADADFTKYFKFVILSDLDGSNPAVYYFDRLENGEYGEIPANKIQVGVTLLTVSVPALGAVLTVIPNEE